MTQDTLTRGKNNNLMHMNKGLIEMEPPKWPKQVVYITFLDKETIICENLTKQRGLCLE